LQNGMCGQKGRLRFLRLTPGPTGKNRPTDGRLMPNVCAGKQKD
jgi:hypothetical protein